MTTATLQEHVQVSTDEAEIVALLEKQFKAHHDKDGAAGRLRACSEVRFRVWGLGSGV